MHPEHLLAGAMLALAGAPVAAQQAADAPRAVVAAAPAGCSYERCAVGIAPLWNGLAVVRGPERAPVANLHFFWPHEVESAFSGDSARWYAGRALSVRRRAAALTDAGGALLAIAAVRGALAGRLDAAGRGMALGGAGFFAAGIPLQFSADGLLSRAVWWHNAAFGR